MKRILKDAPELRQDYERIAKKAMPKGRNFQ